VTDRVRVTLELDLRDALADLDRFEDELNRLSRKDLTIPVTLQGEQAIEELRQDIARVDAQDINVAVDVDGIQAAENQMEDLRQETDRAGDEFDDMRTKARRAGDEVDDVGRRGASSIRGMVGAVAGFGAAIGAAAGIRAFLGFAGDAIDAASDLEESTNKARVVFGEFSDDIERFASTAPQALRLSNQAAIEFAGTFGNLFLALGLSQKAAADLSPQVLQLAADLGSFNNIDVTEVLEKLRAGLVGEAEPLRVLGVNLSEAAVQAKAAELGLGGLNDKLTDVEKVQARWAIILDQTATAQGDAANTADTFAGKLATLRGEFDNFRADAGEALLPAFEALLDAAPAVLEAAELLIPVLGDLATQFADGAEGAAGWAATIATIPNTVGGVFGVVGSLGQALGNVSQVFGDLVTLDPIGAFRNIKQGLEDVENARVTGAITQSINDLITSIAAGVPRVAALAGVLGNLGDVNLPTEEFQELATRLLTIANVPRGELLQTIDDLEAFGRQAGFSADEIEFLRDLFRETADAVGLLAPPLDELVDGVSNVGGAAGSAAPEVAAFLAAFQPLTEVEASQFSGLVGQFEAEVSRLPSSLDAAREALQDTEGKIVSDFSVFLLNLEDELRQRAEFAGNLEILRAMGLDDLAETFTEVGLDAAAALADAVVNPEEARRAEELLDEQARTLADSFLQTFLQETLPGLDLTLPVRVTLLRQIMGITGDPIPGGGGDEIINGRPVAPQTVIEKVEFPPSENPTTDAARVIQYVNSINGPQ
jgi:hypothetical protein